MPALALSARRRRTSHLSRPPPTSSSPPPCLAGSIQAIPSSPPAQALLPQVTPSPRIPSPCTSFAPSTPGPTQEHGSKQRAGLPPTPPPAAAMASTPVDRGHNSLHAIRQDSPHRTTISNSGDSPWGSGVGKADDGQGLGLWEAGRPERGAPTSTQCRGGGVQAIWSGRAETQRVERGLRAAPTSFHRRSHYPSAGRQASPESTSFPSACATVPICRAAIPNCLVRRVAVLKDLNPHTATVAADRP
ncbi:hypothetical protein ABZP36_031712 [Zizania latifolia]